MLRAPKAPERPKAAQRHPIPHQRLSEETFGHSCDVSGVFNPLSPSGHTVRDGCQEGRASEAKPRF